MGGDLNQKKSFHPTLLKNQARVYDEERKALEERKRTQQRIEEIKQERKQEELQRQLEAAGGRKKVDRVDWMYQGPTDGGQGGGAPEELEAYLLGKRRIVIKDAETKKLEKQAGEEAFLTAGSTANNARDMAAKMREDPLLAIKRQEQARYDAIMNDPLQRRQLLAKSGIQEPKPVKKERRHRRRTDRDGDSDDDRRRRTERPRRRRSDSRDSSDERGQKRDNHRRGRSDSRDYHHSGDDRRSRSPDPRRSGGDSDRRRREDDHARDGRPRYDREGHSRGAWRENGASHPRRPSNGNERDAGENGLDERSRKLAAMQSAAADLDQDRERRLAALEERESAARNADDRARASEIADGRQFANSLHRKAMDSNGLGDRIGRGRRGYQRDDD